VVVPVRAYNGRLKEEPVGALAIAAAQMPPAGADYRPEEDGPDHARAWNDTSAELD
jgi:hypothetical protein